jgi:hypothetical protein
MKKLFLTLAFLLLATPATAGIDFEIRPQSNAIQFSTTGLDLCVTDKNVFAGNEHEYLDFRLVYDHTDSSGNVFYNTNNSLYQLYILDNKLIDPERVAVYGALFTSPVEAVNHGEGEYSIHADNLLMVLPEPGTATLDMEFNTRNHIEGGHISFFPSGSVPEPPTAVLFGIGIGVGLWFVRNKFKP